MIYKCMHIMRDIKNNYKIIYNIKRKKERDTKMIIKKFYLDYYFKIN